MSDPFSESETERYFHEQIPMARAMGVRVAAAGGRELVLTAPLAENHNHLGTAFGGSLAAVATLAGYGMLWLCLDDRNCHIVIRSSTTRFRHPVSGEIRARCEAPDDTALTDFRSRLREKGRASIRLEVVIEENGRTCVEFEADYVAIV